MRRSFPGRGNPLQSLRSLVEERCLDRALRHLVPNRRPCSGSNDRQYSCSGTSGCPRRQRGTKVHALSRARGGPGTKIHVLSDNRGRPIAFHLTGANVSDFSGAEALLPFVPTNGVLHGDKGYNSDRICRIVEARGSLPNIPPHKTRKWKNCFSPYFYKGRNVIEKMFGRLEEFRRFSTRYDRNARSSLSSLCLAATFCYWL